MDNKQTEFINRVKREQISLRTILVKSILITHSHYVRISNIISVSTQELDMSSDLIENTILKRIKTVKKLAAV